MSFEKIFLFLPLALILLLLFLQKVFIRFAFSPRTEVIIEYFPLKLILYNFFKKTKRKKKKKLIKSTKRAIFFFTPLLKSLNFLLNKSAVKIYRALPLPHESEDPHKIFVTGEVSTLFISYIHALFYSLSKETVTEDVYQAEISATNFDVQLSTRLYNVVFASFVFIFFCIKKKGRIEKFV